MNISRFIIIPIILLAAASCQQQKTPNATETISTSIDSSKGDSVKTQGIDEMNQASKNPVATAQLIVPGKRIGQISINESGEDVHKKLGVPDAGDAAMGKSISIWFANKDTTSYVTQIYFSRGQEDDDVQRVKQIRVTSPAFKLNNEIGVGSALDRVKTAYQLIKTATFTEKGVKLFLYDDSKAGIAFDVHNNVISGITVHEPGREAAKTYLSFFPDLKIIE
ncbi:MAG: hypothetical protein V4687_02215 [Bacteroidota bacterium]